MSPITCPTAPAQDADLVLEGGGVKAIGLVGAVSVLLENGYVLRRVAGTSAGAIVGSLLAAGMSGQDLREIMEDLDYRRFADRSLLARIPVVGPPLSLLADKGVYEGNELKRWLGKLLAERGVKTFGDLRIEDSDSSLSSDQRYRLVVMSADISRGRLIRLPWDYRRYYGLDPDRQSVVDAVRASASIPFFYEPVRLRNVVDGTDDLLVDGGLVSSFPIDVFDRADGQPPRWPTFGIKLSARPDANQRPQPNPTRGALQFALAVAATVSNAHDQIHLDDKCVLERTMFVDTGKVGSLDFDLDCEVRRRLYERGRKAATEFLAQWSWAAYLETCRAGQ